VSNLQAVSGFKYLYRRKSTYYLRVKVPKRLGTREVRLCLRTKKLSVAVVILERLLPFISRLKQLVIRSRTLDTSSICLQFTQIKDAMLKQLTVADIDPMIAKLEQGYSDGGHSINALGQKPLMALDDNFMQQFIYIAGAENAQQRDERLAEVVSKLVDGEKWSFVDSFSTVFKNFSAIAGDNIDTDGLSQQANELLTDNGYTVNPNSLPYRVLLSKLKASTALQSELLSSIFSEDFIGERELQGLLASTPVAQQASVPILSEPESTAPLFSQVYEEFLEFKVNKIKLSTKMQEDYQRRHVVWLEVVEDKAIDLYKPKDIGQFIDICFELPKMHILPYRNMTWQERLTCDVPEEDLAAPKTVHQYYKWIMGVFAYAKRDTVAYIETSPCTIKRDFTANVRGIFSDSELRTLIKAAKKERTAWKKWIVYLGIFTGARRGELAQLRKSDIKFDNETGRHYLLITDSHENQNLKTDNAKRKIPVHQELVKAGFIDYVKGCGERVFDEIANANQVTAWMPRHMEKLNIPRLNELDHMRSFHSIRHTFITKRMSEPNINVNLLQQIVGHELSSLGITSHYTHKVTGIKNLWPLIDAFEV
jgi:integrase